MNASDIGMPTLRVLSNFSLEMHVFPVIRRKDILGDLYEGQLLRPVINSLNSLNQAGYHYIYMYVTLLPGMLYYNIRITPCLLPSGTNGLLRK